MSDILLLRELCVVGAVLGSEGRGAGCWPVGLWSGRQPAWARSLPFRLVFAGEPVPVSGPYLSVCSVDDPRGGVDRSGAAVVQWDLDFRWSAHLQPWRPLDGFREEQRWRLRGVGPFPWGRVDLVLRKCRFPKERITGLT